MSDGRCPKCHGYMTTGGCQYCDSQKVSNDIQLSQAHPLDLLNSRADKALLELQKAQYALLQISNAKTLEESQYMACHALVQTCYLLPPVDSSLHESDFDSCVEDWRQANEMNDGQCQRCDSKTIDDKTFYITDETDQSLSFNIVTFTIKYCFDCGLFTVANVEKSNSNDATKQIISIACEVGHEA